MRQLFSIALCLFAASTQAAGPAEKSYELAISGGQVAKEQRVIRVDKGTPVKLRMTSDAAGSLHLHAYKLEAHLAPGTPAELAFNARATGRFRFEWHADNAEAKSGDHHGPPLATLEVMPK
jgi:heme/copper-type cytochrome/quinol oxidase subunit 2